MKVFFLTPYPLGKGPNVRFRLECYLPYLEQAGIRYKVRSFASERFYQILYKRGYFFRKLFFTLSGYFTRLFHFFDSLGYDVICVLREVSPFGPTVFPYLWKFFGKRVIYDFDDAIYLRNMSQVNRMVAFLKRPANTMVFIQSSQRVIAGNNHLARYARRYNFNTVMIPTPIDTAHFTPARNGNRQKICIGWSGSWTTLQHFYRVKGELRKLTQRYPSVHIKVFGTQVANIPGVPLKALDWSLESELEQLRGFDIGIMPLPYDEWSRGKCGFKLLMYMAFGIPTVSSPVGVNIEIIQDGENGFLASTGEEWIKKLSLLIMDPLLRQRIAAAGRKTVEEKYSVAKWGPEFVKALQEN